jgi:carboxylesterase type B
MEILCKFALLESKPHLIGVLLIHGIKFNATFPNNQLVPDGRAYHSSEVKIVFSTYPRDNATTAEECALSDYMRSTWARFAKDPEAGPGWSAIGEAALDVAVLQNGKEAVKLVEQSTLDGRCAVWRDVLVGM